MLLETPQAWPEEVSRQVKKAVKSLGRNADIRNALDSIASLPVDKRGPEFKIGICRTFTIETHIDAFNLGLATLPCRPNIFVGELENIEQILLDSNSQLLQNQPDVILVLWRLEELHPRLFYEYNGMNEVERDSAISSIINRIENICKGYGTYNNAPLFLSTIPENISYNDLSDVYTKCSPKIATLKINLALLRLAEQYPYIYLFDFSGWASEVGGDAFDIKMDLYARQPIHNNSIISFVKKLSDTFRPLVCTPAKVLALDLDNILWGGTLGEDGVNGLKIGHDFPGNIYRRIQLQALALKNRGVMLVLLSKNNLTDVQRAFSVLPDMPLSLKDFSAIRVNWERKSKNIQAVSQELNVSLDSFVFIDDQEFEREEMKYYSPDVYVLDASEDPLNNLEVLLNCNLFNKHRISDEDRNRAADYIAQKERNIRKQQSRNPKEFLCSLNMQAKITRVSDVTISRTAQMLNKTNQFNLTTRRHNEADLRRMLDDTNNTLLLISLSDCFSNQGIVGLIIALGDKVSNTVRVDSFLLSCRVIGRGVEQVLWSNLLLHLSNKGFNTLYADYFRTKKNSLVEGFYDDLGLVKNMTGNHDHFEYSMELPSYFKAPEWIQIKESINDEEK